jgi:tetratricopeptide (TPR) repeat protein
MTAHLAVLAAVVMSPHNPHVLLAGVARDFDAYLASRKPLPPHHGLLLDTRSMPFAKGLLGIAPRMRVEMDLLGDWRSGRADWEFDLPSGRLEIGLWPLAGEPERPPNPNRTSRGILYSTGPAGLGEFAVENRDRFGHEVGWIRGNLQVAVSLSRHPDPGSGRLLPPEAAGQDSSPTSLVPQVAAQIDRWLATLPLVDLVPHRLPLEPIITPADPIFGERVQLAWRHPPADPRRFMIRSTSVSAHLCPEDEPPPNLAFSATSAGQDNVEVCFVDRVTLVASCLTIRFEVFDFAARFAGLAREKLASLLDKERPELSWRIVEELLPNARKQGETLARTYAWWKGDTGRQQIMVAALWPHAPARRALLRDPEFQAALPQWIDFLASSLEIPAGTTEVDGLERHREVTRSVVSELMASQQAAVVTRLTRALRPKIVAGTWLSLAEAFHATRDHRGAIAAMERAYEGVSAADPLYVLWKSNTAVEQMLDGDSDKALRTLDDVLARNWRLSSATRAQSLASLLARGKAGDVKAGRSYALRLYLGMAFYNRACIHALRGDAEPAVRNLAEARRMNPDGYPASKLAEEKDFDKIRETPVFMKFSR